VVFSDLVGALEMDTVGQADIVGTRWYQPIVNSVMTKVALLGDAFFLVKGDCIIRTGVNAGLASSALLIVHYHDAVISFDNRLFQADIDTGGLVTVLTHIDTEDEVESTTHHLWAVSRY
jgi:hypothetical protein